MSDAFAQLYGQQPAAPAQAAPVGSAEAAARAFYNASGGSYPVAPVPPSPPPGVALPAPAPPPAAATPAERPQTAAERLNEAAGVMYGEPVTRGNVDWAEPAAAPEAFQLPMIPIELRLPEGEAAQAEAQFRQGMAAAGAGVSLTNELFGDVIQAQLNPITMSQEQALQQLQSRLGAGWEAKVEAARVLVDRVAEHYPQVRDILERTGLGNDPTFIAKLAKRAAQAGRG